MNGNINIVTVLFLFNAFFSHVESFGHGFTTVTECPKSESEVKEASDRLRCENDTNGNNQYMCLRCINSLVEFCNDHYAMAMIDKGFTPVTECPKSQREIREASDRLRCGNDINGNSQYLCSRFYEENFLVEFCYDGEMGMIEKGHCLEIFEGKLKFRSCHNFPKGCPKITFRFHEIYQYPACQDIIYASSSCNISEAECPTPTVEPTKSLNEISYPVFVGTGCSFLILTLVIFVIFTPKRRSSYVGNTSLQSFSDLVIMEDGFITIATLERRIPPAAPPPPPSNT